MKIAGVGSAFPKHYYPQDVLTTALKAYWGERLNSPQLLDRLYSRMGLEGRFLSLPLDAYYHLDTWGQANSVWIETALELGQTAICGALTHAGLSARDLDALFFTSVTGISSPSVDARLVNRMGLSPNIRRTPIFGLGCVAGAAGIARAADYVRAYPNQAAALLCVELCSLTLQREDVSMANLISAGLFGDGAAAVIVCGSEKAEACGLQGPEILATQSVFYPDTEHIMGWDISERGFKIVLAAELPDLIEGHFGHDVDSFLLAMNLHRSDIGSWILHTGGPKVLDATAHALGLPGEALDASWHCLRKTGNLSSASVLLVFEEVSRRRRPATGTYSLLAAMGPGFCAELVLLRW
ncbi:MAG TPA: 3-oxoacyl-[acyl-carrier-protein] synthase III C-terminal domain-containing protein [Terriglobia bacterium]|nr:3-oxoacyl-[acyl-carrier-protein] synthase III C-terminal domain-containing protein [Terriglobia bacterium]